MEFHVLGPVEVWRDGARVELGGPRQRAVLCRLLLGRGAVVPAERIIDDLWSGDPPPKALGVLQAHISTLRRVLEPERAARAQATVLVSRPPGYALLGQTDAERFTTLLDEGIARLGAGETAAAARTLDESLALWSGTTPYVDFVDEPWLVAEVARLEELHLVAREHRLSASLEAGQAHAAVPALDALATEHPLREGVWRLLALALYRTGRQADALAALRRARATLADQLGLDPSAALQALEAAVLAQDPLLDGPTTPRVEVRSPERVASSSPARTVVGREPPLAQIDGSARQARTGRLETFVVVGEPGIGKTWLIDAAAGRLAEDGWRVVRGHCHEASGAPALWPWLQVLDALAGPDGLPAALREIAGAAGTVAGDAADARFQQHQAIGRYLAAATAAAPLLIVLEDLHWADAASLSLLGDLPELIRDSRLLVLATSRTAEGGPGVTAALGRLARHEGVRLALTGLGPTDVAVLVAASGTHVDAVELTRRTGGNPFLLRETLRSISMYGAGALLERVPETVADLLRQRMTRLPPETQTVLQVAAASGNDIDVELLIAVSGQPEDEVLDALEGAAVTGLLSMDPEGDLRFAHDLVRETLYGDMAPSRRTRVHAQILAALEGRPRGDVSTLATHAAAAGPAAAPSALRWAVAAAEQATGRLAHDDAVRWWTRALKAHEQVATPGTEDHAQRVELLLRLVRAQLDAGDAIAAENAREAAILAADNTQDPLLQVRALVAIDLPGLWVPRSYDNVDLDIVGRLERALQTPDLPDVLRCRLLGTLSNELSYSDPTRRPALASEAVELARRQRDPQLLAFVLTARYLSLDAGRVPAGRENLAIADELLQLGTDHRLPGLLLIGHLMRMVLDAEHYQLASADRHAAEADRLIRRLRHPLMALQLQSWVFNRALLAGEFDQADAALQELARIEVDWWQAGPLFATMRLFFLLRSDRLREAAELLPTVAQIHPAIAHDAHLLLLDLEGHGEEARRLARHGMWPPIQPDWMHAAASCLRARTVTDLGTDDQRRAAYDQLLPFAQTVVVTSSVDGGPTDHYLGRLALSLQDNLLARKHFDDLAALSKRAGLTYWQDIATAELSKVADH